MSLISAGPGPLFIAPVNLLHGTHVPPPAPYSNSPILYVLVAVAVIAFFAAIGGLAFWASRRGGSRSARLRAVEPEISASPIRSTP